MICAQKLLPILELLLHFSFEIVGILGFEVGADCFKMFVKIGVSDQLAELELADQLLILMV
jgi:hypothetical protein